MLTAQRRNAASITSLPCSCSLHSSRNFTACIALRDNLPFKRGSLVEISLLPKLAFVITLLRLPSPSLPLQALNSTYPYTALQHPRHFTLRIPPHHRSLIFSHSFAVNFNCALFPSTISLPAVCLKCATFPAAQSETACIVLPDDVSLKWLAKKIGCEVTLKGRFRWLRQALR